MLVTSPSESRTVKDAYARISSLIEHTPVLTSATLSNRVATSMLKPVNPAKVQDTIRLFFKAENFQKTGSFKYRGALHSIVALSAEELACGLATTSSGKIQ
jgi:threonine dehydratase